MIKAMIDGFVNIFKKPSTTQYPATPLKVEKNYRGLIKYNDEFCIFCDKCENICPPRAILFVQDLDGTKKYNYNPYLCIYCGECVRECPKTKEALWQDEEVSKPAIKADSVNSNWFELEIKAKESRISYKKHKKAKKDI